MPSRTSLDNRNLAHEGLSRLRMKLGDKLGLFYGHDNNAFGAFAFGATGWVSGSGNFDPARWAKIVSDDGGKTWEPQSTAFLHVNSKSVEVNPEVPRKITSQIGFRWEIRFNLMGVDPSALKVAISQCAPLKRSLIEIAVSKRASCEIHVDEFGLSEIGVDEEALRELAAFYRRGFHTNSLELAYLKRGAVQSKIGFHCVAEQQMAVAIHRNTVKVAFSHYVPPRRRGRSDRHRGVTQ